MWHVYMHVWHVHMYVCGLCVCVCVAPEGRGHTLRNGSSPTTHQLDSQHFSVAVQTVGWQFWERTVRSELP